MDHDYLTGPINEWVVILFSWLGFGTVVGLLAKAIMPGRDPGGAIATLTMGIGGAVIGCGVVSYYFEGLRVPLMSPLGLAVGTVGALVLLFFYRLLGGYWFIEGETQRRQAPRRPHHRSRNYASEMDE